MAAMRCNRTLWATSGHGGSQAPQAALSASYSPYVTALTVQNGLGEITAAAKMYSLVLEATNRSGTQHMEPKMPIALPLTWRLHVAADLFVGRARANVLVLTRDHW